MGYDVNFWNKGSIFIHKTTKEIMKAILRGFKYFAKHLFGIGMVVLTILFYYITWRDGIDSFVYPVVGIFAIIFCTGCTILYLYSFRKTKPTIGK